MKTLLKIMKSILWTLSFGLMLSSSVFAQNDSYKTLELDYNNSGFLYYVQPHPEWAKASLTELPNILSEIYQVPKGWSFKELSKMETHSGYIVKVLQTYNKIDVEGGDLILKYDRAGGLEHILGTVRKIDQTPQMPQITFQEAIQKVFDDLEVNELSLDVDPATGQVIRPEGKLEYAPIGRDLNSNFILCYEVEILLNWPARYLYYINARTGEIENVKDALLHSKIRGSSLYSGSVEFEAKKVGNSYHSHDEGRKIRCYDHGYKRAVLASDPSNNCNTPIPVIPLFSDTATNWTDYKKKAVVDIMWGMGKTYDYFKTKHSRNSFDNNGAYIDNRVYFDAFKDPAFSDKICPIDSARLDSTYCNAFWNGKNLSYGNGDSSRAGIYGSINTVGHEFTHAVVQYTAGLEYEGESGALNESFADMFGTAIEFYAKKSVGLNGNWQYGEEHTTPNIPGDCLRDMKAPNTKGDPNAYEQAPYWVDPTDLDRDHGGVHTNSGVGNHWFYLLSEGGTKTTDPNFKVKGVTLDTAEQIAYKALSGYMSSWSDYKQARKATLLAAEDWLGSKETNVYKQVCNAWYAVNVGEKCCDSMEVRFETKNPKCHDSKDGEITTTITKSPGPFTFKWYRGDTTSMVLATSKDLAGREADRYIVIIQDQTTKCEEVADTILEAPPKIGLIIGGGGEYSGPCDRTFDITLTAGAWGGTIPYTYNWTNGRKTITAGGPTGFSRFELAVVTDKNNCREIAGTDVTYTPILCSYDPNDIIGPPAYGEQNWVSINATLPYKIRFENDPKFASGPAQKVTINHPLDSNVDLNSFRLSDFGFYKYNFSVPANTTTYSNRLDIRDSFGIFLDVTAGLDAAKHEAFWIFESIDPATGLPPTDGSKGFLAVNDTTIKNGEGYVDYTIRPKASAQTGDSIRAIANIVFDENPAILTPRIYNLIDAKPPTSKIDSLPAVIDSSKVVIRFNGQDDLGGSGIATYDLYISENNAAYQLLASGISDSSFSFDGNFGSTYHFYSRAKDNTGNLEGAKTTADQTVFISPDEFFKSLDSNTSLCSGDTLSLKWNMASFTNVNLEISSDSGVTFSTLASMVGVADTQYLWVVPHSIVGKKSYLIRALSGASNEPVDTTEYFELKTAPVLSLGPDTSFCDGSTFNFTLDAGSGFSSYLWSDNSSGQTLNATTFGTYTVSVTNSYACIATDSLEITKNLLPSIAGKNQSDPTCFGFSNGSASLYILSGAAPYTYSWSNGDTSAGAIGLSAGKYFVTVTDAKSCQVSDSFVLSQPAVLATSKVITAAKCFGAADGQVDLSVNGGTAPYKYVWSNNDSTQDITGLSAGQYDVLITDANNCTIRDTAVITQPTALAKSKTLTQVKCFGGNDGAVDLTITGGTTPYTYAWSNSASTQDLNNITAGTYTVLVTDANNCTIRDTAIITEPTALAKSKTLTHVKCFGGNDGAVDLTITGGTTPYTYAWSNSATTQDLSNLSAGTYTVLVTDANNCTIRDTAVITQPTVLAKSKSVTNVGCFGANTGSVTLNITGGTTPYTYAWSNSASTANLSNLAAGTYTVLVTDANNCTIRDTAVITQPTALAKSKTLTQVKCFGGNDGAVDLTITGGTTPYTYAWSNSASTQDLNNITAGTYTVLVTDANNCTIRDTAIITEPTALAKSKTLTHVKCFGGNDGVVDLTITGGTTPYTYAWSNSATSQDLSNLASGTYTVLVTDANNCIIRDTASITQPAVLAKSKTVTQVGCFGANTGSVTLNITGGTSPYTYAWSNSASTANLSNLAAGTYTVLVTDANNCTIRDTAVITQPTALAKSKTLTQVKCFGGNDGAVDLTIIGGTAPYTYAWSNSATSQDLSNLTAGTYTVLVTDANNCTIRDTAVITEPTALAKSKTLTQVRCFGGNDGAVDLTITGGTTPYTYAWSNSATTQDLSNLSAGTYTVLVTDANNCIIRDTAVISQPTILAISNNVTNVKCFGGTDGAVDLSVTGGVTPYTFNWAHGSTTEDLLNFPIGTYTVLVTDANNCTIRDTAVIGQPAVLSSTVSVDSVKCFNTATGAINLNVLGGITPYTFAWSNGASTEDLANLPLGEYRVLITDANNCTLRDTAFVAQPDSLTPLLSPYPVLCHGGQSGGIDVLILGGTQPYSYNWSNGETIRDIRNLFTGTYSVTITDRNNCIAIDSIEVTQPAAPLSSDILMTFVNCFGGSDGAANLTVNGGTAPYTFAWSNAALTEDLSNLSAGSYDVLITDANNCTLRDTVVVTQPAAPLATAITWEDVKCFAGNDGSADLSVTGGTLPYQFDWSDGATTEDITGRTTGSYIVVVTDNNNCVIRDTVDIGQPAAPLSSVLSAVAVNCFGGLDGSVDLNPAGGTVPYSFAWNTGATSEDLSNVGTGRYIVVITDANSCVHVDSIDVSQPSAPLSSSISVTDVSCFRGADGALDLSINGGTLPYQYAWAHGPQTEDVSGLQTGKFVVVVTDANNCVLNDSAVIDEPSELQIELGGTSATKGDPNGSVWVNAYGGTPPYAFVWNDDAAQPTDTAKNLIIGLYRVTVTDANGCSKTDTISVPEAPGLEKIRLYPNPSDGPVTIDNLAAFGLDKVLVIEITDINGKRVDEFEITGVDHYTFIAPDSFYSGAFFVKIYDKSNTTRVQYRKLLLVR